MIKNNNFQGTRYYVATFMECPINSCNFCYNISFFIILRTLFIITKVITTVKYRFYCCFLLSS